MAADPDRASEGAASGGPVPDAASGGTAPDAAAPVPPPEVTPPSGPPVPSTRASATWTAVAGALIALAVVLVFILQNLKNVRVSFFSLHWRIPLGVDLLFAAVLGGLVVLLAGSIRVLQLRRLARHHARLAATRRTAVALEERTQ